MIPYLLVFFGGGAGAVLRYAAGSAILQRYGGRFPVSTVLINVTGSFLVGIVMTVLTRGLAHPHWRLLLVVGVLGGYTTFSAFEYETYYAVRQGNPWIGLANVIGSVCLGYVAVWLGAVLGGRS